MRPNAKTQPAERDVLLTQEDVAQRWKLNARTLERWRWQGTGPRFVRIGGAIRYRVKDLEEYEKRRRH
jgi:predicted site-specific integrase-resolvase